MKFTKDDLQGMWAALPTPWKRNGDFDRKTFAGDIARCCKAGMHGLYSGGTTGEFYTQDFDLFSEINETLVKTAHAHGKPVQAGCTALDTAQARKRVQRARRFGADIIQIALPFWLQLDDQETVAFFEAIADAAGPTPIVHYDTGRSKRRISPELYQQIIRRVPTLWGTKFGSSDIYDVRLITLANPGLKVFVGEHVLASATPMGATGAYSSVVLINPRWMIEYFDACRDGRWARAFEIQNQVCRLFVAFGQVFVTQGLQDTAVDRVFGRLTGFLKCSLQSKPPYRASTEEDLRRLQAWVKKNMPEILNGV
ncbi:MAG: dihydrodipicolinate synthase family protein [Verrucomicrobia bacterium]|nr:dihydrodipicolinate synthase family protein [Verrucomicrobiota bacterium]